MRLCPTCRATYLGAEVYCTKDATQLFPADDDTIAAARVGMTVGNYRILGIVGRGGMGAVYAAEHVYIGKRVAVKILHERFAKNEATVGRFLREARAATAIAHPNIVDVIDFGAGQGGTVYLAMEFLEGRNLEEVLEREAPVALHRAIGIVHQIASALASAHDKGIIHSDLKPANIMLIERPGRRELIRADGQAADGQPRFVIEKEGPFDFVKVLDFGIARIHDPAAPETDTEQVFGTPEYMAPETARGGPITPASDVYALGLLFYEMVTGDVPFHADTPIEVLRQQLADAPLPPRRANPGAEITEAAERLILRMLAKEPDLRPRSMDELRSILPSCYGSVAFRRDADRVPGAAAQGLAPRPRRLTDELDEWLAREKALMASRAEAARARRQASTQEMDRQTLEMAAGEAAAAAAATARAAAAVVRGEGAVADAAGQDEPILLTDRKPI